MPVRAFRFGDGAEAEGLKSSIRALFPDLTVQAVDAGISANERFIEMIAAQTQEAAATGALLARKVEVDLLLRLGGTTQIADAVDKVGAKRGMPFLLVVSGKERELEKIDKKDGAKWDRLARDALTKAELKRVELAALLDAVRA